MKSFGSWLVSLCLCATATAQTLTSPNLVPNPGHWTTGGQTANQSFAINQALIQSGSPVRVNGFEWGYTYSLDAGGAVASSTIITNSSGQTLHSHTSSQSDGPTYGLRGAGYHWNLPASLPQASLGTFAYALTAEGPAVVFDSYVRAKYTVDPTTTTGNVIYSTANPAPAGASVSWSGFVTGYDSGGLSGGHAPNYHVGSGTFMFGWLPGTVAYTVALNSVLAGTGLQIGGMEYGLQYYNQDYSRGSLSATWSLRNSANEVVQSYTHNLPQTTEGWTNFSQTKTWWHSPYLLSNLGTATFSATGVDDRFWAGYYGPQFRGQYMRFIYTQDQCAANALSSPDCPGYAAAFLSQQCTISALYNPACPGYTAAYFAQQCSANSLHDPACPGYAQAYKTQQCSINALYATDCPGYQQAYFDQQCQANGLYSTTCPNYAEAYAKKNVLGIGTTTTTTATTTAVTTESTTSTAKTDPISIATTSTTTSTTSPTSVTSVTSVVSGGTSSATTAAITSTSTQSTTAAPTTSPTTTTEAKKTDNEVRSVTSTSTSGSTSRDTAKNRAETVARQVAREASEAKTFEAQAATQSLVVGLMGFVPGFDAYGQARIADVNAQQMARLYNRPTVDNRQALRRLTGASDRLHTEMVDQQYQLGK